MGLESVELVISWEREFGISIPNRMAAELVTPQAAGDAIEEVLHGAGRPMSRVAIDEIIRKTTLDLTGMEAADYRIDGRFLEHFGLD